MSDENTAVEPSVDRFTAAFEQLWKQEGDAVPTPDASSEAGTWSDQLAMTNGLPPWVYLSSLPGSNAFLLGGRTGLLAAGQRVGPGAYGWQITARSVRSWLFEVAWPTNLYVAVGDHATVLTSGNGVDWSLELVPPALTNAIFLGVGGTTNLLVAAGNHCSLMISPHALTNLVITNDTGHVVTQEVSTLGIIWYPVQPRPTTNDLQGVTYHNGQYGVTGDRGLILLSADGTNWAQHLAPTTNLLSSIAGFPGGWVATGDDGAVVFSGDGTNWSKVTGGTSQWLYRVRYFNVPVPRGQTQGLLASRVHVARCCFTPICSCPDTVGAARVSAGSSRATP